MELTWLLIAVLTITGWGGFLGWSIEHIEKRCHERNAMLLAESREGPLQACTEEEE